MTLLPRRTIASIVLVISLILILTIIAVLQYQWTGEISEGVHNRMKESLRISMNQVQLQFTNELRQLTFLFRPDPGILEQKDWKKYGENCSAQLNEADTHLVNDIYIWLGGNGGGSRLFRLNHNSRNFEPVDWPSRLLPVRERYHDFFYNLPRTSPGRFAWTMFYRIPVLTQPMFQFRPQQDFPGNDNSFIGFVMIELNQDEIKSVMLPEIARKAFNSQDDSPYRVAVVDELSKTIVYGSNSDLTMMEFAQPDASIKLIEDSRELPEPWGDFGRGRGGPRGRESLPGPEPPWERGRGMRGRGMGPPPGPYLDRQDRPDRPPDRGRAPISVDPEGSDWTLVAKHREGSLEAAVAGSRRRSLAISFGSLLLLAISMTLIISSARRAQRLARLKLDFVAGISHELRTPLAVICSAGDNLAEGVVGNSNHTAKKYGELIRDEGRKLAGMIEQILHFAGLQRGPRRYNLRPIQINDVAETALKQAENLISAGGFLVNRDFASTLSPINADPAALTQVVQNLIQNALKYSGESRRLAVRTQEVPVKRGTEVQLIVEDNGMGIDKEDLPHIFEPFYRGKKAMDEQIHGAGLGLYMVRETLLSMGAKINAESAPGKGSSFTLSFKADAAHSRITTQSQQEAK
jgi:signal transduction histidine kinase